MQIFLNEYLSVLKLEKNLAENTVISYRNDISTLIRFLADDKIDDPQQVKHQYLVDFFKSLNQAGLTGSSAARYYSSFPN